MSKINPEKMQLNPVAFVNLHLTPASRVIVRLKIAVLRRATTFSMTYQDLT